MKIAYLILLFFLSQAVFSDENSKECQENPDYQEAHKEVFNEALISYDKCRAAVKATLYYKDLAECYRKNRESNDSYSSCSLVMGYDNLTDKEEIAFCDDLKPTDMEIDIWLKEAIRERNIQECMQVNDRY